PNLTLPYWDYQTNPVIPPDWRANTAGNPLYHARSATMNAGGSLSSSIMTAIDNSLDNVSYYDFQSDLEGPHGSVHTAVGGATGDMSSINKAAKDPVFWLHHANIDRLWEVWRKKCGGRANPTTPATSDWMTHVFTFFDETGAAVNMTGSQVVSTAASLNYWYEVPSNVLCLTIYRPIFYKKYPILRLPDPGPVEIREGVIRKSFKNARIDELNSFMKNMNRKTFNFANTEKPDRLFIELENVNISSLPDGVVEVYLNLGPNDPGGPNSKSFVGVLDLFSASHKMAGMDMGKTLRINASKAARNLGLSVADLARAEVSFIVRGNSMQGREVKTSSSIIINKINFAVDLPEK
ncbi:MAG TPA: tyrosinase family protein, partial [Ferruginibacter sp.]|nr:tyrosinase family protein [Ferruginibacter sp.]